MTAVASARSFHEAKLRRPRRQVARSAALDTVVCVITKYIAKALERAVYERVERGAFCATVRGLRGVIATGNSIEECRHDLAEVVEEWLLMRVAHRLPIPRLGGVAIRVRRAG